MSGAWISVHHFSNSSIVRCSARLISHMTLIIGSPFVDRWSEAAGSGARSRLPAAKLRVLLVAQRRRIRDDLDDPAPGRDRVAPAVALAGLLARQVERPLERATARRHDRGDRRVDVVG